MKKEFYFKLALNNIRKNKQLITPYMISSSVMAAVFYIVAALWQNTSMEGFKGAYRVHEMLGFGIYVIALFAAIVIFYSDNFILKHRKREFGLYNMLGMEKRHIFRIVTLEKVYTTFISLAAGIITGLVFNRAVFLLLLKVVGEKTPIRFQIPPAAIGETAVLFAAIFLVNVINSLRQIGFSNTIELLRSSDVGEKEPRSKWILAILGVACIGIGYYLSVSIENPVAAISRFFAAVLLVIIGTYLIFIAGSIVFLKMLRKNKKYYYKTRHFISVSGMLYRMKQNAASLASICILSTMVLVTVSGTMALFAGSQDVVDTVYPREISIEILQFYFDSSQEDKAAYEEHEAGVKALLDEIITEQGCKGTDLVDLKYINIAVVEDGEYYRFCDDNGSFDDAENLSVLAFFDEENYNRLTGENISLNSNEVLIYQPQEDYGYDSINLEGNIFQVAEKRTKIKNADIFGGTLFHYICVVVKDNETLMDLYNQQQEYLVSGTKGGTTAVKTYYGMNIDPEKSSKVEDIFLERYMKYCEETRLSDHEVLHGAVYITAKKEAADDEIAMYSGLFFVGIFLGIVFLITTIMIIYYKQLSEGYQDRRRFEIMEKVGLTKQEVKKSIHSQVLTIFFMPLIVAGFHTGFAFPLISKGLQLFGMTNTRLFALCVIGCYLVFAAVYAVIYMMTSRTYYKIVSQRR